MFGGENMAKQNDFSKGKISSIILSLAIPLTVAQLINVLYNIFLNNKNIHLAYKL